MYDKIHYKLKKNALKKKKTWPLEKSHTHTKKDCSKCLSPEYECVILMTQEGAISSVYNIHGMAIPMEENQVCGTHTASQVALVVKNSPASAGEVRGSLGSLGPEDPLRRAWQPTPVFLPRESMYQVNNVKGFRACKLATGLLVGTSLKSEPTASHLSMQG